MLKELYDAVIKQPFDNERYSPQPKSKLKGFDVKILGIRDKNNNLSVSITVDMGRAIPNEGNIILADEIRNLYEKKKRVLVENIHWIFNIEIKLPLVYEYDSLFNLERLDNIDDIIYVDKDSLKTQLVTKLSLLRDNVTREYNEFVYKRVLFGVENEDERKYFEKFLKNPLRN